MTRPTYAIAHGSAAVQAARIIAAVAREGEASEVSTQSSDGQPVAEQQRADFWRVTRPVYHMAMPVNADGDGPASPDETVKFEHEVWDQLCRTLCKCSFEEDARLIADAINAYRPTTTP